MSVAIQPDTRGDDSVKFFLTIRLSETVIVISNQGLLIKHGGHGHDCLPAFIPSGIHPGGVGRRPKRADFAAGAR